MQKGEDFESITSASI